jgi:hypothetical protein
LSGFAAFSLAFSLLSCFLSAEDETVLCGVCDPALLTKGKRSPGAALLFLSAENKNVNTFIYTVVKVCIQ